MGSAYLSEELKILQGFQSPNPHNLFTTKVKDLNGNNTVIKLSGSIGPMELQEKARVDVSEEFYFLTDLRLYKAMEEVKEGILFSTPNCKGLFASEITLFTEIRVVEGALPKHGPLGLLVLYPGVLDSKALKTLYCHSLRESHRCLL